MDHSLLSCYGPQNRAVINLFKGPNNIDSIAEAVSRLERGDLKLRVRALEVSCTITEIGQVLSSNFSISQITNQGIL
jgi:hypothetical protein